MRVGFPTVASFATGDQHAIRVGLYHHLVTASTVGFAIEATALETEWAWRLEIVSLPPEWAYATAGGLCHQHGLCCRNGLCHCSGLVSGDELATWVS